MITLNDFIRINNIQQVDAIVLRKKFLGMVDHYAIFLGYRSDKPVFVANYRDGVREVSDNELNNILEIMNPKEIEHFQGNEIERAFALKRAMSRIGERAYSYIANNCEHFKNWVHNGEHRSEQVKGAGNLALIAGGGTALYAIATKNPKAGLLAFGLLLFGALLKDVAEG